jgi:hypothetical protein
MRAERLISRSKAVVDGLSRSTRRVWWTSFVLVTLLTGLWVVANPLYAGPDEPAHVIKAVAVDHGQLTGKELSPRLREVFRDERQDFEMVRVPAIYGIASSSTCFSYERDFPANCLDFSGSIKEVDDATYVARHPPAYYAVVGIASWIGTPGSGAVYLMRFISALMTSALLATAITALRRSTAPREVAVGVALAITPMVLFVSSLVNPSALEIAAAVTVWVCGLVLISRAHERIDNWLVAGTGIAACAMALSRQLAPLWLGLIGLTLLGLANRAALRNLVRSNWARLWGLLVVASAMGQVLWNIVVKPLDVSAEGRPPMHLEIGDILEIVTGRTFFRYHEMIGVFGWGDTPTPALTWIPWTAGIVFLVFAAVLWVSRRQLLMLLALLAAVVVVPVLIESATYNEGGGVNWQGRYTLPLAVGVPILAAVALGTTARGRQVVTSRFMLGVGVVVGVGQVLAFAQNLRRYTVGYDGDIQFWKDPFWSPPVSSLVLTIAFVVASGLYLWWLLCVVPNGSVRGQDTTGYGRAGTYQNHAVGKATASSLGGGGTPSKSTPAMPSLRIIW